MSAFDDLGPGERLPVPETLYSTYRRCPQQALARLQGVHPPTTRASFKGSLAHRIFARHLTDGPIDVYSFEQACREDAGAPLGESMASLMMKPSEFGALVSEVATLYERFASLPDEGFVAAEQPVEAEPSDGLMIRGRIDAVFDDDGRTRIVDWKTGADLTFTIPQLEFYAMAWQEAFGEPPATLEAMSLRTGERVVEHPTSQDLERVRMEVAAMVGELRSAIAESRELPRTAGPACRWCPLLDTCTEGRAAMELLA